MNLLTETALADALAQQATLFTVAQALALAGAIIVAVLFLNPKRRSAHRGFWQKVSEHVNFEHFLLSSILKFLYVFTALSAFVYGAIQLFSGAFLAGVLMMVAAPLGLRVLFELLMLLMSIREEAGETNDLLRRMQGLPPKTQPKPAAEPPKQPQQPRQPARQGRMQPDPRYAQQQAPAFTPQNGGYGTYTAQPRIQPQAQPQQPYTDFAASQRYAPVRPSSYAGYEAQPVQPQQQAQPLPVARPTPADGTGRYQAVPMRDMTEKK